MREKLRKILKEIFNIDPEEQSFDALKSKNSIKIYELHKFLGHITEHFNQHPRNVIHKEDIDDIVDAAKQLKAQAIKEYSDQTVQTIRLINYILNYFTV